MDDSRQPLRRLRWGKSARHHIRCAGFDRKAHADRGRDAAGFVLFHLEVIWCNSSRHRTVLGEWGSAKDGGYGSAGHVADSGRLQRFSEQGRRPTTWTATVCAVAAIGEIVRTWTFTVRRIALGRRMRTTRRHCGQSVVQRAVDGFERASRPDHSCRHAVTASLGC